MLKQLTIGNYALIDSLSISFDDGFSVITGETGAGKSILLGALVFVIGDRSDSSIMLDETKKCTVEATFIVDNERFKSFFEANDLDFDDEIILRRELTPTKKSRAFINDTPVTVMLLALCVGSPSSKASCSISLRIPSFAWKVPMPLSFTE